MPDESGRPEPAQGKDAMSVDAMSVSLTEVCGGADLRTWVRLPFELYRGDPLYVPPLIKDELDFFTPAKNPSFGIADTRMVLARKNGRPVGRVCGIIHGPEAEKLRSWGIGAAGSAGSSASRTRRSPAPCWATWRHGSPMSPAGR